MNDLPPTYNVDGTKMTGGPSNLAVASATLAPDSSALTISGHTLSPANEGALVVDGHTTILTAAGFGDSKQHQTCTVKGIPLTGNAVALVAGCKTLTPGSPTIQNNTPSHLSGNGWYPQQ